jgi:hypothetical protein
VPAAAQETPNQPPIEAAGSNKRTGWAGVGLGVATDPYGLSSNASLSTRRRGLVFSLGYTGASNLKSTVTLNAASLGVGGYTLARGLHLSAVVGPALVWGVDQRDEDGFATLNEQFTTAGLVGDMTAFLGLGSYVRLGAGAWVNANQEKTAFGVGPRLQIRVF